MVIRRVKCHNLVLVSIFDVVVAGGTMKNSGFAVLLTIATCTAGIADASAATSPKSVSRTTTGCADAIPITLSPGGWESGDGKSFPQPRLTAFRIAATTAFRQAGDHACAVVPAVRRALASVKAVRIAPGAGATEPTFYRAAGQLVFQYAFNESNLALPPQADIERGLRCYADPKRRECADMGD